MRDMVCDVITSCFRSCDVGKRSRCDKIVGPDLKPAKIETKMKKNILHEFSSGRCFQSGIHSLRM